MLRTALQRECNRRSISLSRRLSLFSCLTCPPSRHELPMRFRGLEATRARFRVPQRPATTRAFQDDTVYALSSAHGKAGIAIIRISGPGCVDIYKGLCPSKPVPKPRYASLRTLNDPESPEKGDILDDSALLLYFPAPNTVTGEDVLELHVHGGHATVKAVLAAIPKCRSNAIIRYAEPGEFTKRAFLNNRLDLAQAESLGDTLAAETEQQRRAAVRGGSGALGRTYDDWREQLLLARAEIEALIDFSEDQHFDESPTELLGNVAVLVRDLLGSIGVHELASQRSELLRNGIRIALLGPPNVGKSSLMNLIVGREASIVSTEAGTTRDVVEASLDIRGYLCTFADTAGFRSKDSIPSAQLQEGKLGSVEEEGIRRAKLKALDSDIVIVMASIEHDSQGGLFVRSDAETLQLASRAQQCVIAINKIDSVGEAAELSILASDFVASALAEVPGLGAAVPLLISCKEAEADAARQHAGAGGIQGLVQRLLRSFEAMTSMPPDLQHLLAVTVRARQLLGQCRGHLEDFMAEARRGEGDGEAQEPDVVLAAEHLRAAANCLAKITGRVESGDVEDVLGVIFEKFCVGK